MTKTRPFLSTCYGYPSTTEVPPCCQAATKKLTFSTTSVLLLLNVPLSLSRATIFRRQKNPRRVYRPKIAGILFVCNEPEGKYYTVPTCPHGTCSCVAACIPWWRPWCYRWNCCKCTCSSSRDAVCQTYAYWGCLTYAERTADANADAATKA